MLHTLGIIWNPELGIEIGPITIRFYSLMFVTAFGLGWYLMKKIYDREGETVENLDKLFIYSIVGILAGARLGHCFFYDGAYHFSSFTRFLEIFLPVRFEPEFHFTGFTGLASHGAAIAVIILMIYYSKSVIKKPILWILDRVVIPVSSGAIFVRLGNFFNSEIFGHPTDAAHFYAVKFVRGEDNLTDNVAMKLTGFNNSSDAYNAIATNPQFSEIFNAIPFRHPAQLYEAFGYVFVFLIVYFSYWKTDARNYAGRIFGVFLILLWSVRFVVEYVKESQGGFESILGMFSTGQWLSIPFILWGVYLVSVSKKSNLKQ